MAKMNEWMNEWRSEWVSKQASKRPNEWTNEITNERMLFVWQCEHLSDMWLSTLEFGSAQLRFVTEIAPKSPFLCENRSPSRYGRTDGRTNERTNAFRVAVWTPIRYVTLYFRARHGAASPRYRNRAEITVLMWEEKGNWLALAIFTLKRVNMALANQLPVIIMATTERIQGWRQQDSNWQTLFHKETWL